MSIIIFIKLFSKADEITHFDSKTLSETILEQR